MVEKPTFEDDRGEILAREQMFSVPGSLHVWTDRPNVGPRQDKPTISMITFAPHIELGKPGTTLTGL